MQCKWIEEILLFPVVQKSSRALEVTEKNASKFKVMKKMYCFLVNGCEVLMLSTS